MKNQRQKKKIETKGRNLAHKEMELVILSFLENLLQCPLIRDLNEKKKINSKIKLIFCLFYLIRENERRKQRRTEEKRKKEREMKNKKERGRENEMKRKN